MLSITSDINSYYAKEYDKKVKGTNLASIEQMFTYFNCDNLEIVKYTGSNTVYIILVKNNKVIDITVVSLGDKNIWNILKGLEKVFKYSLKKYKSVNIKCHISKKRSIYWLFRFSRMFNLKVLYDSDRKTINFFKGGM